ncbi:ferrous iron transport protein A [Riemerella anatipestifer]|uniref:FeoA family protein n=1 Tax=Riemerella anatipestifer TaxID=34085 RepID=UPI0012AE1C79|nr:FeoA family protein [Riemerella anatipestifer]USL94663.1 ferrous iron transport protein A [Riemerella anatipestifer]
MKSIAEDKLNIFPKHTYGRVLGYDDSQLEMPTKIMEMGLLPDTVFKVLYQAPFNGPLYIEFGEEKNRIALREEEAAYILVELM